MKFIKLFGFIFLFSWISFFPEPLQGQYAFWVRVALGIFLLILALGKWRWRTIFNIHDWPAWIFLFSMSVGMVSATDKTLAIKTYFYIVSTFFLLFYIGKALVSSKDFTKISIVISV